ncbi:hypothetical protein QF023_001862 [Chryseobacterium sp. SLBN-27]|nr:hypothetical protein [Chryseobacterium sp. SLBN-27]MDR6158346.1 hypothetical protein [Chryseobacterium sp. SLBN-27]
MKNIAALALISTIALISCNKKETAKITKIDPKTEKNHYSGSSC